VTQPLVPSSPSDVSVLARTGAPAAARPAGRVLEEAAFVAALEQTWRRPRGFYGWLVSTDHKDIGLRFIVTAMVFFVLAGLLALAMRVQLAVPLNTVLGPDRYNQFFTTHGTAMMFLFAVPIMEGFGLYLVPLMVGTRNVSFPRLLNYSYYIYLCAGLALFTGLAFNMGPDVGWFAYTPLSGPDFSPGHRVDLWSQMVTLIEIASLSGAVEIITTVFKQKAPGMSLNRMPIFVWAHVVTSFMILFAMPAVMLCSTMLSTDRLTHLTTHIYNQAEGGDALLWQHLFWFFAHPEVYIIFIPATAFVSAILPTFCRRKIFGYTPLVLSMVATAFIGFGVWVHHMFATPIPDLGQGLFTASSLMIVVPNGIQMFCWIATIWGGKRPAMKTPFLFVLGFIATFVIGGLTGVILASVAIDLQVHDTFFVVAHLHYVLIGGAVFPLFAAFYYWFPKWTGRMLSERLGVANFVLLFVGFHLTFWPMHHLGLHGMPRRIYTYVPETGWMHLNLLATVGAFTIAAAVLLFAVNVLVSLRRGQVAGNDPWGAGTFEWATTSPPPAYNFAYPPTCQGSEPLWENAPDARVVSGLATDYREVLSTTTLDAAPDHRYSLARETIATVLLALATAFLLLAGGIFNPKYALYGFAAVGLTLFWWFWSESRQRPEEVTAAGRVEQ
jgi:cytochrome c oxidase subunit 1